MDIHCNFIFPLNYVDLHSTYIDTQTIYAELKILFHLPPIIKSYILHSYFLCYLEHIVEHIDHH